MDKVINRIAKRDYICDKCNRVIFKGSEYIDTESKIKIDHGWQITHIRKHKLCGINLPLIVFYNDNKEWLCGKGYRNMELMLITHDWNNGKYHWRKFVYNDQGDHIKPEDISL